MGSRPSKKRKKDVLLFSDPEPEHCGVHLRLLRRDQKKFNLESPIFIKLSKLQYVTFNDTEARYLYHVCSVLFHVFESKTTLYHSTSERELDDDDALWEPVESDDPIKGGQYLLVFDEDAGQFSPLNLYC